jgi:DNA-binding NarL/FixJ family response regulator
MSFLYFPIKLVIADDHGIFRDGVKLLLKNQKEVELVGEAEDGAELLELAAREEPDVAIIDIKMPVMDGIEACKQIRKRFPYMKVIALSMFNDDNLIVDMLEAGARGYLLKNTNKNELLEATRTVHEGNTYYCAATSDKLARMIGESRFNPYRSQPVQKFSQREVDIIRMICQQFTNKEIATQLGISIRTVESHREKIQEKTGAKNSVGVAIYAIKHKLYEM